MQNGRFAFWAPSGGLGKCTLLILGLLESAYRGLPMSDNWTFVAMCYGWGLRAKIDLKSAFSKERGQFGPKVQVQGVRKLDMNGPFYVV